MAAALLHDVGKTREFTYGAEFGISEEGRLLGHLAIGAQIDRRGRRAGWRDERRLALLNCVLSHHGPDAGPGPGRTRRAGRLGSGFASAGGAGALPPERARRLGQGRARARLTRAGPRPPARGRRTRAPEPAGRRRWRPPPRPRTPSGDSAPTIGRRGRGRCRSRAGARRRRAPTATIASSEVASASSWVSSRKIARAGTNRIPPPTPSRPPTTPPAKPRRPRGHVLHQPIRRSDRDARPAAARRAGDRALGRPLLQRGAGHHAGQRRDADERRLRRGRRCRRAPGRSAASAAMIDDRGQAGPGRLALAVAEPEDQERDDHGAAADPEQAAERARPRSRSRPASAIRSRRHRRDTRSADDRPDPLLRAAARRSRGGGGPLRRRRHPGADRRRPRGRGGAASRPATVLAGLAGALPAGRLHHRAAGRGRAPDRRRRRARLRRQPRLRAARPGRRASRAATPAVGIAGAAAAGFVERLDWRPAGARPGCGSRTRAPIQALHWRGPPTRGAGRDARPRRSPTLAQAAGLVAALGAQGAGDAADRRDRQGIGDRAAAARGRRADARCSAATTRPTSTPSRRCAGLAAGAAAGRGLRRRRLRRGPEELDGRADVVVDGTEGFRRLLEACASPSMLFCDLLRVTVLLVAGVATALGAVTVIVANQDSDYTTLIVAGGLVADRRHPRGSRSAARREPAEAMARTLASARTATSLPAESPGRIAFQRLWPIGAFALVGAGAGLDLAAGRRRRRRLRDPGRARLAPPRGGRRGDRGARRRPLLRRAVLGLQPDQADAHPRPHPRPHAGRRHPPPPPAALAAA